MLSRQIASRLRGYETPFYLYDTALLRQTLESVVYESNKYGYKVHYAIKANYDDHLLAIIREYGLGIDCASGNELRKAVEAGFAPEGIVYAGVGKRDKELRYAIEQGIMAINCESIGELEVVDALSAEAGRVTDVALRINPDIDPKTNHCIDTGQADSKFGISYEEVLEHAAEIKSLAHINIVGIHLHIGSQIRELHVFENMCNKVNVIVENLERLGFSFRFVDVGGGLGVNYDVPENEPIPNFASLFSIVHNHLRVGDKEVHFEFGRIDRRRVRRADHHGSLQQDHGHGPQAGDRRCLDDRTDPPGALRLLPQHREHHGRRGGPARQVYGRGHGLRIDRRLRPEREPAPHAARRSADDQVGRSLRHVDGLALQPARSSGGGLQRRDQITTPQLYRKAAASRLPCVFRNPNEFYCHVVVACLCLGRAARPL